MLTIHGYSKAAVRQGGEAGRYSLGASQHEKDNRRVCACVHECARPCAHPRVFIMVNSDRRSYSACPYLSLSHLNCNLCKHLSIPQLLAVITCHRRNGEQNPPQPLSILYQHAPRGPRLCSFLFTVAL